MSENETNIPAGQEPEILVNHDQIPGDPTVVVAETDRTVVSTKNETIVIDKPRSGEVMPTNRQRKVYSGMWGRTEIAVFGSSLFLLLAVFFLYILLVVPAGKELDQTRAQRDQLEQELISARSKYGGITSTQTQVEKLVSSVSDFESAYLPVSATGRTALYQRLNGLIASYGLVNTNGPNYAPLDGPDQQNGNGTEQNDQENGRAKFRSIFPGVYVTMTVEGPYQNLRRFIREIETGGEFVIISSVELEPTETKKKEQDLTQPPPVQQPVQQPQFSQGFPGASNSRFNDPRNPMRGMPVQPIQQQPVERPQGKTHGETVSLRLEMAAYFRREVAAPPVTQEVQ